MYLLQNPTQAYAWGSLSALPEFLGNPSPSPHPQAELWMGAHPSGPSQLLREGRWECLGAFLQQRPEALGPGWRSLPFLLKILAVHRPLSLQAHPNLDQARLGYARERALGLSPEDANYRDANHKPELLCALTPFEALIGFETPARLRQLFSALALPSLHQALPLLLHADTAQALRSFFSLLLCWPPEKRPALLAEAKAALIRMAQPPQDDDGALPTPPPPQTDVPAPDGAHTMPTAGFADKAALALRLLEEYPADTGVLASLCLHLVRLQPLQALFVPPGCLHAYIAGMGVEVMANSDNVLRAGLTPKRVDVQALLSVLRFQSFLPPIETALPAEGEEHTLHAPVSEFRLSLLRVAPQAPCAPPRLGPEILLVVEGEVVAQGPQGSLRLRRGQSAFVPANEGPYVLMGKALVVRAGATAPMATAPVACA